MWFTECYRNLNVYERSSTMNCQNTSRITNHYLCQKYLASMARMGPAICRLVVLGLCSKVFDARFCGASFAFENKFDWRSGAGTATTDKTASWTTRKHRLMENMSVSVSRADESEILRFIFARRSSFLDKRKDCRVKWIVRRGTVHGTRFSRRSV